VHYEIKNLPLILISLYGEVLFLLKIIVNDEVLILLEDQYMYFLQHLLTIIIHSLIYWILTILKYDIIIHLVLFPLIFLIHLNPTHLVQQKPLQELEFYLPDRQLIMIYNHYKLYELQYRTYQLNLNLLSYRHNKS
jgi:hypothetical protein